MLSVLKYLNDKSERGFTLIELLVAIFIVGILAAIASPNLIGFLSRNRIIAAMNQLEGAIKETQWQAMQLGSTCRVNINPSTNLVTGNPTRCLLNNRKIKDGITIRTNLSGNPPNISFSYKGNTTKMGTIVLSSDNTDLQKCFVIALGTGISRTGRYTGNRTGSVSSTRCIVTE